MPDLSATKEGDLLVVISGWFHKSYALARAERTTPTTIIINGSRFRCWDGKRVGESFNDVPTYASADPRDVVVAYIEKFRKKYGDQWQRKHSALSDIRNDLVEILALLDRALGENGDG